MEIEEASYYGSLPVLEGKGHGEEKESGDSSFMAHGFIKTILIPIAFLTCLSMTSTITLGNPRLGPCGRPVASNNTPPTIETCQCSQSSRRSNNESREQQRRDSRTEASFQIVATDPNQRKKNSSKI